MGNGIGSAATNEPLAMVLHCPECGFQHVDRPDPATGWTNPPHKSHLCGNCKCIWRPAGVPTAGVEVLSSVGRTDTWSPIDADNRAQIEHRRRSATDNVWHGWINRRQEQRRAEGAEKYEHDLYEWKSLLASMPGMAHQLRKARTGTLAATHKQCSMSPTEPIENNRLVCAMGQEVTTCPILNDLYVYFTERRNDGRFNSYYSIIREEDVDEVAAKACGWHMFTEKMRGEGFDTSEGYLLDESDRRFWSNVYESLSQTGEEK